MTSKNEITVTGGRLYYEVRGDGPLLLAMGSPMGADAFAPLADALADRFTVVTHDPRGISRSALDDPREDSTPRLRAEDVVAILDDLGAETADVFGSSGGAMTTLALAARHPGRIRTVVAHEPPTLNLLPDAVDRHAEVDEIVKTFETDGLEAAWRMFLSTSGYQEDEAGPPPSDSPEQDLEDGRRFFVHELRETTRYIPDLDALRDGPFRVVVGLGADSGGLLTRRTCAALADELGVPVVEFPGDHGGFIWDPEGFAKLLGDILMTENVRIPLARV
ncbi:hydrolase [Amycolatopsis orientalis]|uniref:Hydrolase n=1 Tax=Amycolatopsis orientalis TaxID=31958 RepID=A0A193BSC4_AMYOR|nr:alpha/beta hydrolase [Amycolatopsis orientalis]ANN15105.1 hydrolase [Amycolatopsis orientalis]